jgi:hypothetical protein
VLSSKEGFGEILDVSGISTIHERLNTVSATNDPFPFERIVRRSKDSNQVTGSRRFAERLRMSC